MGKLVRSDSSRAPEFVHSQLFYDTNSRTVYNTHYNTYYYLFSFVFFVLFCSKEPHQLQHSHVILDLHPHYIDPHLHFFGSPLYCLPSIIFQHIHYFGNCTYTNCLWQFQLSIAVVIPTNHQPKLIMPPLSWPP